MKFLLLAMLLSTGAQAALECTNAEDATQHFRVFEKNGGWQFQAYEVYEDSTICRSRWGCEYSEEITYEEPMTRDSDSDYRTVTWMGEEVTVRYEENEYYLRWKGEEYFLLACD